MPACHCLDGAQRPYRVCLLSSSTQAEQMNPKSRLYPKWGVYANSLSAISCLKSSQTTLWHSISAVTLRSGCFSQCLHRYFRIISWTGEASARFCQQLSVGGCPPWASVSSPVWRAHKAYLAYIFCGVQWCGMELMFSEHPLYASSVLAFFSVSLPKAMWGPG